VHAKVIAVVHIGELGSTVASGFHRETLPPRGCGLLLYKSYSAGGGRRLYKPIGGLSPQGPVASIQFVGGPDTV
jgi:hypothetical protein